MNSGSLFRRISVAALPLVAVGLASAARAQSKPVGSATVFHNVRIFDGKGGERSAPSDVLVKGTS
jgi:hypothetical protein